MTLKHLVSALHRRLAAVNLSATATPRRRRAAAVLSLLVLSALAQATPTHAAGQRDAGSGPLGQAQPLVGAPAQNLSGSGPHGLGFVGNRTAISAVQVHTAATLSLPSAVDLSAYNPPVGDQGSVGSCTAGPPATTCAASTPSATATTRPAAARGREA